MKRLTTTLKFAPVVKPAKRPKAKRNWQAVSLQDALSISLRYGFKAVAWGKW